MKKIVLVLVVLLFDAPAPSGELVSFMVSKSCCLTISANVSRAGTTGVVMEDPDEVVTVNSPVPYAPIEIEDGCECPGDIVPPGAPDGWITTADMGYLIQRLIQKGPPYMIGPGAADPLYELCADLVPPGAPDGWITTADMGYLIQMLVQAGPPYIERCGIW